jgi:hypothetical protein
MLLRRRRLENGHDEGQGTDCRVDLFDASDRMILW